MTIDENAKVIWDYMQLNQPLKKADAIIVLGSSDVRVAEHAAKLYQDGWAPHVVFSGGKGKLTEEWSETEAEKFSNIAKSLGVPESVMLRETESTNTGENLLFTKQLLEEKGISISSALLVQKPYMERRAYATARIRWPEVAWIMSSPDISWEDYPNEACPKDEMIAVMVGDLERIKKYPERGWQVAQEIPDEVWRAYEALVQKGYTRYLIP